MGNCKTYKLLIGTCRVNSGLALVARSMTRVNSGLALVEYVNHFQYLIVVLPANSFITAVTVVISN